MFIGAGRVAVKDDVLTGLTVAEMATEPNFPRNAKTNSSQKIIALDALSQSTPSSMSTGRFSSTHTGMLIVDGPTVIVITVHPAGVATALSAQRIPAHVQAFKSHRRLLVNFR